MTILTKGMGIVANWSLKNLKKRIKKTPDKIFREDKTYELSTGKFGKITSGKEQKKKIIQQQQAIKNKDPVDYRSPIHFRSKD
jgi:hypothetical protein